MDEEGPAEQRHQEEEADGEPALSGGTQQIVAGLTKNKQHRDERQRNEPFPGGRRAGPSGDDSHGGQDEDQGDSGGEDPVPYIMSCVHGGHLRRRASSWLFPAPQLSDPCYHGSEPGGVPTMLQSVN